MAGRSVIFLLTCAVLTAAPERTLRPSDLHVDDATVAAEQKAALAWNMNILVGAYDGIGSRNPKWDDAARKGLTLTARLWAHDPTRPGDADDQAWYWLHTAVKLGCDDPLVQYLDVQYSRADIDALEGAHQTYYTMIKLIPTRYHAFLKSVALVESADSLSLASAGKHLSKEEWEPRWNSILVIINRAHELSPALFADREIPAGQLIDHMNDFFDPWGRGGNDRMKYFSWVEEEWVKVRSPKDPLLQLMRADLLTASAWDVRGTGWAKDVKEDAWPIFYDRLRQAEAEAAKAVAQGWSNFAIVRVMNSVALGLDYSDAEKDQWFELGKRLSPGDIRPYYSRAYALSPRWHGPGDDVHGFTRQLKATGGWTDELPFLLINAYEDKWCGCAGASEQYLSRPEVTADVLAVFQPFLAKYPDSGWARGQYVRWLARAGRWTEVKSQLKLIAPDRFRVGAFGGQAKYDEIRKRAEQ